MGRSGDSGPVMRAWWRIPPVVVTPHTHSATNPAWQWQFMWPGNAPPLHVGSRKIASTGRAFSSVRPDPQALSPTPSDMVGLRAHPLTITPSYRAGEAAAPPD